MRRLMSTAMAMAVLAAGVRLAVVRAAQEPPAERTPSFPSQVSAITVDAVVVDAAGAPIRGLVRDDFTILEDGRPQTIVGFEARYLQAWPPVTEDPSASPLRGTNVGSAAGRVLVVVIDDLNLKPRTATEVRTALAAWIRAAPRPDDEVTLITTSGEIWWTDAVGAGREDLLAVLERLKAHYRGDLALTAEEASLMESGAGSVLNRVARRLAEAHQCSVCSYCGDPLASCRAAAASGAHLAHLELRRRLDALLGTLERLARSLAPIPGRKSVLVVSEGFPREQTMEDRYRAVIDAAQRANTSVYFTGARGLTGPSGFDVESESPSAPGDIASMSMESNVLAFAGAEKLSEETGGAMTKSNDLAAGLERAAADVSAYYLLGYQPEPSASGKWHRLEVRVDRPGATVRARRGYRAGPPALPSPVPPSDVKGKGARRELQAVIDAALAGGTRDAIPLRMALGVRGPDGAGGARVQVVVELDASKLQMDATATGAKAAVELTILAVARERPSVVPLREWIDLGLRRRDVGWLDLVRELRLPPGVIQVRASVRDRAGTAAGTARARIDVPDVAAPYLSTPILTDRTQPPPSPGQPPPLVPTARRHFARGGVVHCQYEVFGFGGRDMPGVPRVAGGYTLKAGDGRVIESVPPTAIATDSHHVVRRITFPTERLDPGAYELLLTVEDRLAQRAFSTREAFVVEAADSPR
jgi:VWFA-related protein